MWFLDYLRLKNYSFNCQDLQQLPLRLLGLFKLGLVYFCWHRLLVINYF